MREPPRIGEERLRTCLQDQYNLLPVIFEFLPLGHDYDAGVYHVVCAQDRAYLLKATSRKLYESSCLVPAYLRNQGITSIVAPVPTKNGSLWTKLGDWTLILYPWINGDSSLTGITNAQWKEVGSIFQRIHCTKVPPAGLESLRKEHFDPTEYATWIDTFETQHLQEPRSVSDSQRALRSSWKAHQLTIHSALTTLEKLAEMLQSSTIPYVICHADLHARNLIRDPTGNVHVIDWEEETRAQVAQTFHDSLSGGNNLHAALEASAHISI